MSKPTSRSRSWRSLALALLVAAGTIGVTGCVKQMILDGQIEGTRKGAQAMNGTADYEVARAAASAGLAQFEGMHMLAPENENGIYLLVKGYSSYAFGFVEDDMQSAYLEGKDDLGDYHKERVRSLYTRAIGFGEQWMERKHAGFGEAVKSGRDDAIVEYVKKFTDKSDADILFWVGQAWMSRANALKEAALVGTVYVGRAIIDRVRQLDEGIERGSVHVLLGSFDARTGEAMLGEESFKLARAHFDRAKAINGGKVLLGDVQEALSYACRMSDDSPGRAKSFALYRKLLEGVLAADDPLPEARLLNAIAKRKARRFLSQKWIEDFAKPDCGWDMSSMVATAQ